MRRTIAIIWFFGVSGFFVFLGLRLFFTDSDFRWAVGCVLGPVAMFLSMTWAAHVIDEPRTRK